MEGSYVFTPVYYLGKKFFCQVRRSVPFVRLSVCCLSHDFWPQFSSNRSESFFLYVGDRPRIAMLNFGEDLNPDPDLRISSVILHH